MTDRYHFSYGESTVYAHVVSLIHRLRPAEGDVIIDLGCGFGAIAEPIRDLGLTYLGFDVDVRGLEDLEERGFETECLDLYNPTDSIRKIDKKLGDRSLAGVVMIDTLEHITNGQDILSALNELSVANGGVPLFIAVPNVTHFDLGAKLLLGRWDITPTGLLDETHVAFFSASGLQSVALRAGWSEIARNDYILADSDQHFPADVAVLARGTPLNAVLSEIRTNAEDGSICNEFVRAYAPLKAPLQASASTDEAELPFLSVLVRTQGIRSSTLEETLLSLAAQTCQDFEVLLLAHDVDASMLAEIEMLVSRFAGDFPDRVTIIPIHGGGRAKPLNVGVQEARGSYVAILDDDDLAMAHWVETYKHTASKARGQILRSISAEQEVRSAVWPGGRLGYEIVGRPRCPYAQVFDLVEHFVENHSPNCGYALPRSAFVDLGVSFDESLAVLEDWDVLVRVAMWCGVADSGEVTALWRRWKSGESSHQIHSELEWARARGAVIAKLDSVPLILPRHSADAVRDLYERGRVLRAQYDSLFSHTQELESAVASARQQLAEVHTSTSWRATAPLRLVGRLLRRVISKKSA